MSFVTVEKGSRMSHHSGSDSTVHDLPVYTCCLPPKIFLINFFPLPSSGREAQASQEKQRCHREARHRQHGAGTRQRETRGRKSEAGRRVALSDDDGGGFQRALAVAGL